MAWNGSGTFTRTNGTYSGATTWAQDAANGFDIEATRFDTHDQDLAAGINACLAKNGENAMTGDLNLGTNDITNGGSATFTGTVTAATLAGQSASTSAVGLVELATDAETQTGTDTARAITPANLQACTATETRKGVVELATTAEAAAGADTARAVTPAGVAAAISALGGGGDYFADVTQVWSGSATSVASSSLSSTTAGVYLVEYDQSGAGSLWYGIVHIKSVSLGSGRRYSGTVNLHAAFQASQVFYLGSGSAGSFYATAFNVDTGSETNYNIKTIWRVG